MNIDGLGDSIIEDLYNLKYISKVSDIYNLNKYKKDIMELEGYGEKSVTNMLNAIENSKNNSLERLIFGLGIRDVGATCSLFLARCYKNIDNLLQATKEELVTHKDIGEIVSTSIYD